MCSPPRAARDDWRRAALPWADLWLPFQGEDWTGPSAKPPDPATHDRRGGLAAIPCGISKSTDFEESERRGSLGEAELRGSAFAKPEFGNEIAKAHAGHPSCSFVTQTPKAASGPPRPTAFGCEGKHLDTFPSAASSMQFIATISLRSLLQSCSQQSKGKNVTDA